ncbi:uncharacterized protein [Amphiura filiformis]|uniref:uncharacterized protein n=1 Tax=Amphiura filiformis TaxID=82378 RepID=UPI003B221202
MDEWELSKENVQPLKSGRKVANLTAALQPNNVDRQQIILQRQALEAELRAYVGDDPIAPWDNYIRWTEQTFPRGGKESNMMVLLQRCVQQFKDEACYKNDPRYVGAWLKLATSFSSDPLEMYQFMRDQGIGFQAADFYEAYAWQLEQVGNTKKADSVYQEGINCKALPLGRLEGLHREFQYRVARSTMEQMQEAEYDQPQPRGPQRSVLGGLKGRGKQHKVGTQRTGGAVKRSGSAGLGIQTPASQLGNQFAVFDEEAGASSHPAGAAAALPAPTGEWENMPPPEQARKGNEPNAGPWAGQRVRQSRTPSIGLDEVSSYSRASFTVHVDDTPQPITTPHKLPEMGNQVLSARKPAKPTDTLKNIQKAIISTTDDGKTKVMYCKHLIYGGTTEMSIEEIRAIKVKAKKEEKRLAAEREALRKRQEGLQEQQQLMLQKQEEFERKVQERLEQQQLRHQEELKRIQEQQQMREQELHMKMMTMQPPPPQVAPPHHAASHIPPPQVSQENVVPSHPIQVHRNNAVDQQNGGIAAPVARFPVAQNVRSRPANENEQPMDIAAAAPQQPMMQIHHDVPTAKPVTAPTPEEKHRQTVDRAQQQLQELRHQMHNHQLNESVCASGKEQLGNNQEQQDQTGIISCQQQLQFDETKTVNWQHLIAQTNQPTPYLTNIAQSNLPTPSLSKINKPPPLPINTSVVTPNASGVFNTSSANTSQLKTPLDRSRPDSRASSNSGRLHRFTPCRTPRGIAAPSPTVNTKEALGAIMAMLNNPLAVDEGWKPTMDEDLSGVSDNQKFDFASEFTKEEPKPPTKCAFAIATDDDEFKYLDNQENHPPKDYVAPEPDARPRSGILQPSIGVPVMPVDQEQDAPMEQQHEEQDGEMEGIEPMKQDENDMQHQANATSYHESTIMHHSTHAAFEAAARMASTPFNPQFGSERPSFSLAMSSIKAPMNSSLHQPTPNPPAPTESHPISSAPFSIFPDPVPPATVAKPCESSIPAVQMKEEAANGSQTVGAARVEVSGIESFDINETTINPPRQLSPIMETSAEDNPSSASSSNGSQPPSLAASQIQQHQQQSVTSDSLHMSAMKSAQKLNASNLANSDNKENIASQHKVDVSQLSNFVSVRKSSSSSQGSVGESKYESEFHIDNDDLFCSTKIHDSKVGDMQSHFQQNENGLANDMSSLMINNQSLHKSWVAPQDQDTSISAAAIAHQNQSLLNHSSRPVDYHSQSNLENHYKSMHESRIEEQLQNLSIHQDSAAVTSQQQNQSVLNYSSARPSEQQNQSVLNYSTARPSEQQNQSVLNYSTARPSEQQNQSVLNYSTARPSEQQNQSVLNYSTARPSEQQNQSVLNYSTARPSEQQNQSVLNYSSAQQQNQSMLNYSSARPSEHQNQSLLNFSSTIPSEQQNQSMLNYSSARPSEQLIINPWDSGLIQNLLANLKPPLTSYPGYTVIENGLPGIGPDLAVGLGNELYTISEKVGQGAFATIYSANILDEDDFELDGGDKNVALKVEKPACPWEFYISKQLQIRTKKLGGVNVSKSLMDIENAYLFDNGSCLITELYTSGTLLDVVNRCGKDGLPEAVIVYFSIELLHLMEKMHTSQIIHGDIKPDNILLTNMDTGDFNGNEGYPAISEGYTKYIKLIDMGRGIDMSLFPAGTVFTARSGTSGFDCVEMQTGRPWTFQTDLYGLAGTLFCMLCGTYMKTYQEGGRWKTTAKWKRYWKADWKSILDSLLNIPSCQEQPSLASIRQDLEVVFDSHYRESKFEDAMVNLANLI